jgi:hypothetical protein
MAVGEFGGDDWLFGRIRGLLYKFVPHVALVLVEPLACGVVSQ